MGHMVTASFDGRYGDDGIPVYPDNVQILHKDYEDGSDSFDREKVELMQYTGLKDKNGKEIYEGDMVKNNKGRNKVIEWDIGCASYHAKPYEPVVDCAFVSGSDNIADDFEIIGNIYENPMRTRD